METKNMHRGSLHLSGGIGNLGAHKVETSAGKEISDPRGTDLPSGNWSIITDTKLTSNNISLLSPTSSSIPSLSSAVLSSPANNQSEAVAMDGLQSWHPEWGLSLQGI